MTERRRPGKRSVNKDHWIQRALRHNRHGRVHRNVYEHFGPRAFTSRGTIKTKYLVEGKELAKKDHNRSLEDAYDFAIEEHEGKF